MRNRRIGLALLGSMLGLVGTCAFTYGVLFVEDPLIAVGIGSIVGGILVGLNAATRPWSRAATLTVAVVMTLPLAFVAWVLWTLAHEST
jgi:hypothetical protein